MKPLTSTVLGVAMMAVSAGAVASDRTDFVLNMPVISQNESTQIREVELVIPFETEEGVLGSAEAHYVLQDSAPFGNLGPEDVLWVTVRREKQSRYGIWGENREKVFYLEDWGWDGIRTGADEFYDKVLGMRVSSLSSEDERNAAGERTKEILNRGVKAYKAGRE